MDRGAFARRRIGVGLLLGLLLRAPRASAEPAEADETRAGTLDGMMAEERPSAVEAPQGDGFEEEATRAARESSFEPEVRTGGGAPPAHVGDVLERMRVRSLYLTDPAVIHAGLDGRVDLSPGGDAGRWGSLAGGGVSALTRGPEAGLFGGASSSLFDVGGGLEVGLARRRGGLLPVLLWLFSPEGKLEHRDYQTWATYAPSARDRFSAFGFGPHDLVGEKRAGILERWGDACRPRITFTW